jgi:hypothetical protein
MPVKITLALRKFVLESSRVQTAYLQAEKRVLTRAAARGRVMARRRMQKRNRPSAPGEGPSVRKGQLKRFLIYAYETEKHVSLFGPRKLAGANQNTPEVLEKGLTAPRKVGRGRNRRSKAIRFQKRPAMQPALAELTPGLPAMWKNAIR